MSSRKDYVAIAAALRPLLSDKRVDRYTFVRCVEELAFVFYKDNTAFKRTEFFLACGVLPDLGE